MAADLDDLDDAGEKASSKREYAGKDFPNLAEGEHTFQILGASLKELQTGVIFTLKLGVDEGEKLHEGEKAYWLKDKNGVNERNLNGLKADLKVLGADVDEWTKTNNRPFTAELKRSIVALVGVKYVGVKKINAGSGANADKKYTNLYINKRAKDNRPEVIDKAAIDAAEKETKEEVPF